jgi:hypothetical protein
MMHLLNLLKEMDGGDSSGKQSTNDAIASLISEFEEEVAIMEQRIRNPLLTNGEEGGLLMEGLPRGWVALEDPDSGDVYYSNEVSCYFVDKVIGKKRSYILLENSIVITDHR